MHGKSYLFASPHWSNSRPWYYANILFVCIWILWNFVYLSTMVFRLDFFSILSIINFTFQWDCLVERCNFFFSSHCPKCPIPAIVGDFTLLEYQPKKFNGNNHKWSSWKKIAVIVNNMKMLSCLSQPKWWVGNKAGAWREGKSSDQLIVKVV